MANTRLLLLGIILLCTSRVLAASDSTAIGLRPDGREFMAEKHFFGKRIEHFQAVPGRPQLCISFIEKIPPLNQELGLYDLLKHRLLWTAEIDFQKDNYIMTSQGILVEWDDKTRLLSDDGDIQWETRFFPVYIDEESSTVLGFRNWKSKEMVGVSLRDGTVRWQGEMRHRYGCSMFRKMDDGRLIIAAEDLCLLDPLTGRMKAIQANMGAKSGRINSAAFLAGYFGGLVGGALFGALSGFHNITVPVPGNMPGAIHSLHSNLCIDEDRIYFADRDQLWCLDNDFNTLWQRGLKKRSSMSVLKVKDDTLYYTNMGIGLDSQNHEVRDTKAYNMAYDKKDGSPLIGNERQDDDDETGTLSFCFLKAKDEDSFTPLWLTYEQMESQDGKRLYSIDKRLTSQLYSIHLGSDYWIVDESGNICLHLNQPILQTQLIGNTFICLNMTNTIFQFDISDL